LRALRSATEFSGRYRDDGHWRHGDSLHRGRRHLYLPHCKHPPCDRADRRRLLGFFILRPGERRLAMRAIFFEIGEREIMLCQEPITFAELGRRGVLGRQLASSRPGAITLCRRYVISHGLPTDPKKAPQERTTRTRPKNAPQERAPRTCPKNVPQERAPRTCPKDMPQKHATLLGGSATGQGSLWISPNCTVLPRAVAGKRPYMRDSSEFWERARCAA